MKPRTFASYLVAYLLIISLACLAQNENEQPSIRQPAVAGSFYPADPVQLKNQLADFFQDNESVQHDENIIALIAPHAGYVFSGEVAASAYAQLNRDKSYEHIFVLGPSHHVRMDGASIYNQGNYLTPLGPVKVDTALANQLISEYPFFQFVPSAHKQEHSIEVQLPFLQYWLHKPITIVPILPGTQSVITCNKIADALKPYFNSRNLFVISSDFSHYPTYKGAEKADQTTGDAIATNSPNNFLKAIRKNESQGIAGLLTSACGWSTILIALYMSSETPGTKVKHVKYQNSGDTKYGDKQRVVGYHSFVFTQNKANSNVDFSLSSEDKIELLKLARNSIRNWLNDKKQPSIDENKLSNELKTPCGAFVTLHKKGKLRGCIGQFTPTQPLYRVVQQMALAAAFQDYRFDPVTQDELKDIDLEISVLTPLKRIQSVDEFKLGKQGIYMVKGNRKGTFLPQVAKQTKWTKEEFLGHCARDKAGIGWNGWNDAELYTYEALIFSEKELLQP